MTDEPEETTGKHLTLRVDISRGSDYAPGRWRVAVTVTNLQSKKTMVHTKPVDVIKGCIEGERVAILAMQAAHLASEVVLREMSQ